MECDVAVIGSGPAGIQAAIHAARRKVSVVIIGKPQNSAMAGARIENYFGMPGEVNGELILKNGMSQIKIYVDGMQMGGALTPYITSAMNGALMGLGITK